MLQLTISLVMVGCTETERSDPCFLFFLVFLHLFLSLSCSEQIRKALFRKTRWLFFCLSATNSCRSCRSALYNILYLKGNRFFQVAFGRKKKTTLKRSVLRLDYFCFHLTFCLVVLLLTYSILSCGWIVVFHNEFFLYGWQLTNHGLCCCLADLFW